MIKYLSQSPAESPGARTSPGTYSPACLADMSSQLYPEQSGGGDGVGLQSMKSINEDATLDDPVAHSTNAGTTTNELPRKKELPLMPVVPVFIRLNVSERADSVEPFPKKNVQPSNHTR